MRVNVDSQEVRRLYSQGGAETDESTQLYMVETERVVEESLEEVLTISGSDMEEMFKSRGVSSKSSFIFPEIF